MTREILNYGDYLIHQQWMEEALELAEEASLAGEVPVGAIIVDHQGKAIAKAANRKQRDQDPTAHAEILAIRRATRIKQNCYLPDCTLYVTLEPCPMCTGAIIQARLDLVVYGINDTKTGAIRTVINLINSPAANYRPRVLTNIKEFQCRQQLQSWFVKQRNQPKK